jgi:hypothetical protein
VAKGRITVGAREWSEPVVTVDPTCGSRDLQLRNTRVEQDDVGSRFQGTGHRIGPELPPEQPIDPIDCRRDKLSLRELHDLPVLAIRGPEGTQVRAIQNVGLARGSQRPPIEFDTPAPTVPKARVSDGKRVE